jgi:hypothetical protein
MVKVIQQQVAQPAEAGNRVLYDDRSVDYASLYVLAGDKRFAAEAEKIVLAMVNDADFWNNPGSKGLTRAAGAMRASLAFDVCADAWSDANRKLVSEKLRLAGENLMKSMGRGANSGTANNWQAVRYGGAGIAFLASDEDGGAEKAKEALAQLKRHLVANLGDNGWNPEGIGYTQYPWQFSGPFGIAAQRAGIGDLRQEVKKAALTFWTTYAGTVSIPREGGVGLRADLGDDHACWSGDGTAGLAFWYAPPEQLPAMKFMYDYLCGAKGDRSWDSASHGGLYSILYYPVELAAKNPKEVMGLDFTDKSHGIAIFRNAFQDENDIVALVNGHRRQPTGCHGGPDTNTFRILGLGGCWVVGGGRTGDPGGQTNLFAGPPVVPRKGGGSGLGKLDACEFSPDGGGYAVVSGSCLGVQDQRRLFGADYSRKSGAAAVFVTAETSQNGRLWRLNTPEFNEISTSGNTFTLRGPTGASLAGTVVEPAKVAFRTGTFERGGGAGHVGFPYRGKKYINNKWLEFDCDKNVVVVLTLQDKGQAAPKVTGGGDATRASLQVGPLGIAIDAAKIVFGVPARARERSTRGVDVQGVPGRKGRRLLARAVSSAAKRRRFAGRCLKVL